MKRFLTILFTTLLLTAALCVTASASDYDAVAEELSAIGMFRGTGSGFELDRAPTRSEAAIMLVRLYGAEDDAKAAYASGEIKHPFTDVSSTAAPYVAWMYTNGISKGATATTFGSASKCTAQNYVVFLLRALGYKDGTDFQYAEALDFAVTKGLMDLSFYTGEFLRDDLAAVTYQALACKLADGSTYLLDSLVKSGAIDETAARPIISKYETYEALVSSTMGAMQDSLDVDVAMKMDMDMTGKGTADGEPMDMTANVDVTAKGRVQMILDKNLQMGLQLDMSMDMDMKEAGGQSMMTMSQPISMGVWVKDNWVYVQQGEELYKADMGDSMDEFLGIYQEMLAQMNDLGGASTAMMMPYIESISATKSGGSTVYTMTLNGDTYTGMVDDLLDMIFSSLDEEIGLALDLDLSKCGYTYTVDSRGQLKNAAASMSMTMKMDMSEAGESASVNVAADVDMEMKVNATGSGVKVSYPDLSKFPDIETIIQAEPELSPAPPSVNAVNPA
nr:S-layer homology domain-containing protein [uncultured Oscillibacter sp.]